MAKQSKPIHLITIHYGYECYTVCDRHLAAAPIEATIRRGYRHSRARGTFNPKKVTCKRCLKHPDYKEALDKVNNPLFYWKENR